MGEVGDWARFFLGGWGTSFLAYVVLQVIALFTLRKWYRFAAIIPCVAMVPVVVVTIHAFAQQSNMWPMLMILVSPIAVLAIAALEVFGLNLQAHPRRRALTLITIGIAAFVCVFEVSGYLDAA